MRQPVTADTIHRLLKELGRRSKGPGAIYLVGGATALLEGWRESTVDVDLKLDPEPPGIFEAIRDLKSSLEINIELSAPDQFLPPVPGWKERSIRIGRFGEIEVLHYDPLSQALAKLARGHDRDLLDVRAMIERKLTTIHDILDSLEQIRADLLRYPSLDEAALESRVRRFAATFDD